MNSGIKASLIATASGLTGLQAYAAIYFVLFLCGLGLPVPEDITLVIAGVLASLGSISLTGALIVGFVGVLTGDAILFFIGRRYGRRVFDSRLLNKIFTPKRLAKAEVKVLSNSKFICFTARFLPGLRAPIYLTAGALGVKPSIFLSLDGLAALISVPVWVVLGYWFGNNLEEAFQYAKKTQIYFFAGIAVLILGYLLFRIRSKRREALLEPKT